MAKLTMEFIYGFSNELIDELNTTNGVISASSDKKFLTIEYDEKILDCEKLLNICDSIDDLTHEALISFDKHDNNRKIYTLHLKNICCEYCYMSVVRQLFKIKGITKFNNDYNSIIDYTDEGDYVCEYNPNLITPKKLEELQEKI